MRRNRFCLICMPRNSETTLRPLILKRSMSCALILPIVERSFPAIKMSSTYRTSRIIFSFLSEVETIFVKTQANLRFSTREKLIFVYHYRGSVFKP